MNANAAFEELSTDRFFKGIVIDGVDVGGMTKEQAKGIAMAISDMMKKPTDKKPRVKNESNDSKQTEKNS